MTRKKIVVTGFGLVSCFGNNAETFHQSLLQGKSGAKTITEFSCEELPTQFAAKIENFDSEGYIDKKQERRVDPYISYTFVAGKKALEMAGLEKDLSLDKSRVGVIVGSGMGGVHTFTDAVLTMRDKGAKRMSPFFIPYVITNMGSAMLAMEYGFMGPAYSLSTACATANYSIISAADHIRRGSADVMVCGGVEAPINLMGVAGFSACRALSKRNEAPEKASRPWDKGRDGFVIGEGAGVLVLESLEHAKARGAQIYGEYLGGAFSCDAHHITEPREDGEGVAQCVRKALDDAQINQSQVSYINAHATSTVAGDMAEVLAMKKVFKNPSKIWMNATKSMIGHGLGAAGGLEAISTLLQIRDQTVHPTINLEEPEAEIEFMVSGDAREAPIDYAISNSFGFGGHNASVVFAKFKG